MDRLQGSTSCNAANAGQLASAGEQLAAQSEEVAIAVQKLRVVDGSANGSTRRLSQAGYPGDGFAEPGETPLLPPRPGQQRSGQQRPGNGKPTCRLT